MRGALASLLRRYRRFRASTTMSQQDALQSFLKMQATALAWIPLLLCLGLLYFYGQGFVAGVPEALMRLMSLHSLTHLELVIMATAILLLPRMLLVLVIGESVVLGIRFYCWLQIANTNQWTFFASEAKWIGISDEKVRMEQAERKQRLEVMMTDSERAARLLPLIVLGAEVVLVLIVIVTILLRSMRLL